MASYPAMASSKRLTISSVFCVFFLLLLSPAPSLVSAHLGKRCRGFHTAFSFADFSTGTQKLNLLGDAKLVGSGLQIAGSEAFSSGGIFYSESVHLTSLFRKGQSKSFSTVFSFSMDSSKGDGLTFVIAPSKVFHGSNGAWLGLSDKPADLTHTVAIEFDASANAEVQDPSGNHVGFDLESLVSLATAEVSDGFSLSEGERLFAWIDYIAPAKVLEVRLSRSEAKRPEKPILSYNVDLADVWQEEMYIGFTASTGNLPQKHTLYSWSFITRGMGPFSDFHPGTFVPHEGHGEWHHGPRDWHHGPHDWHHGPHDWHHGHENWHHEGFPYWPGHDMPHEWHPDHPRPHHEDNDESWFDGLDDVWGVVVSLLFGVVGGVVVAGLVLHIWCIVRRFYGLNSDDNAGFVLGYQTLTVADEKDKDVKINANGYQKVSTTEPENV